MHLVVLRTNAKLIIFIFACLCLLAAAAIFEPLNPHNEQPTKTLESIDLQAIQDLFDKTNPTDHELALRKSLAIIVMNKLFDTYTPEFGRSESEAWAKSNDSNPTEKKK